MVGTAIKTRIVGVLMSTQFISNRLSAMARAALTVLMLSPQLGLHAAVLEEIIVTAQKRTQSANDVGIAIETISGENLRDRGIIDTAALASAIPGFTFSESGFGTPIYTLRGVGFDDPSVQSTSTVGVYVDEVAIPYPIMTRGVLMDMARVEVLKGPQGTLYGRNSTGGAINYITNKPTDEFEASVSVGYGRFDVTEVSGFVSASLSDTMGVRIAGKTTRSSEGWQESLTTDAELGEQERNALRAILVFNPTESLDITVNASWWNDKSDTQAPQAVAFDFQDPSNVAVVNALIEGTTLALKEENRDADWTQNSSIYDFANDIESTSLSVSLKWDLSDSVTLTSLSSYSELKDDSSTYSLDGISGPIFPSIPSLVPGAEATDPQSNFVKQNKVDMEAFSQELRLSGVAGDVDWLAGLYYASDDIQGLRPTLAELTTNTDFAEFLQFDQFENRSQLDTELYALFAHTNWRFTESVRLNAGIRYTEDTKDFEGCTADDGSNQIAPFFGAAPGQCISLDSMGVPGSFIDSLEQDSVSGRLGLDYVWNDDHLLYLSYSRGFKSGGYPTLDATAQAQLAPVVQEKLDAWELGFKSTLANGAIQLNGSVFYYDYTDKQLQGFVNDPVFGVLGRLVNVPESEVTGLELELQWQLTEEWYVSGSMAHVDTEVTEYVGLDVLGSTINFDGYEFPNSPKTTGNVSVNYETALGTELTGGFAFDAVYQSEMQSTFTDSASFEIDGYTVANARAFLGSADGAWRAMLWVRNISDEFTVTSRFGAVDTVLQFTGLPRTYGIQFTYNWM